MHLALQTRRVRGDSSKWCNLSVGLCPQNTGQSHKLNTVGKSNTAYDIKCTAFRIKIAVDQENKVDIFTPLLYDRDGSHFWKMTHYITEYERKLATSRLRRRRQGHYKVIFHRNTRKKKVTATLERQV